LEEDVVLDAEGVFGEIYIEDFERAIGGELDVILLKNEISQEKLHELEKKREEEKMPELSLESLSYIKNIGRG
jgi:hypothetical protein